MHSANPAAPETTISPNVAVAKVSADGWLRVPAATTRWVGALLSAPRDTRLSPIGAWRLRHRAR